MFYYDIEENELLCKSLTDLVVLKKGYDIEHSIILTEEQAENYALCDECGELIDKNSDGYYTTAEGNTICESCYCDDYLTCEDCGEIHHIDDLNIVYVIHRGTKEPSRYVCNSCISDYNRCDECGDYFEIGYTYSDDDGNCVCDKCFNDYDYTHCYNCGRLTREPEWIDDEPYCESCAAYEDAQAIHNYSYMPELVWHDTAEDRTAEINHAKTSKNYTFGYELEVHAERYTAADFLNHFNSNNIYLTEDGSIKNGGYEITSHPMTYNYIFNSDFTNDLKNALKFLQNNDVKGHNHGGLHIHISRSDLSDYKVRAVIATIIYNAANFDTILKITQRQEDKLREWADIDSKGMTNSEVFNQVAAYGSLFDEKYQGINFQHSDTIEFRIFNSNIRFERLKKNFEFLKLLIDYAEYITNLYSDEQSIKRITHNFDIDEVLKFAQWHNADAQYSNLLEFLQLDIIETSTIAA